MATYIKDVLANGDAGTATKWGGDDIMKLDQLFGDVDNGLTAVVNSIFKVRSGKFKFRDSGNDHDYTLVFANISANRNLNVPLITADDTIAVLGLTQTFTAAQVISVASSGTAVELLVPVNTVGTHPDLLFRMRNSVNTTTTYGTIRANIVTNTSGAEDGAIEMFIRRAGSLPTASPTFIFSRGGTVGLFHNTSTQFDEFGVDFEALDSGSALQQYGMIVMELMDTAAGSEDGQFDFDLVRNGTVNRIMKLDNEGGLKIGRDSSNLRGVPSCLATNTNDVTFINSAVENTMSSRTIKGNVTGVDGQWEVKFFGYILQNSVTATTYTLRVKVGGTTIWAGPITPAIAQDADKRPFYMEFNFFPSNQSTTTARMNGFISINDGGVPTTGQGNVADDEIDSNGPIRAEGISWTFANDTVVAFTIQMDQAQAATSWLMDAERWTYYPS